MPHLLCLHDCSIASKTNDRALVSEYRYWKVSNGRSHSNYNIGDIPQGLASKLKQN